MPTKYPQGVAGRRVRSRPSGSDFDFNRLAPRDLTARVTGWLVQTLMPLGLWVGREFFPVAHAGGIYWITRDKDVRRVLDDPDVFGVPYGPEMRELAGGGDFVLGVDGPSQARQNAIIRRIIVGGDRQRIAAWSTAFSCSLLEGGGGRLDVVADLVVRVPTEICGRYFGLAFPDPDRFAEWAMAISALLFADPNGDDTKKDLALKGAERLRLIIDTAISRALQKGLDEPFETLTLVERLVYLWQAEPDLGLDQKEIRAIILGLVVGFIPTNGLAAANMLEILFARPEAFAEAVRAAKTGDADSMRRVATEAGRLNPALSPGQWRLTRRAAKVEGASIPEGATVMAATASAMRDRRAHREPGRFDSRREGEADLTFGHATHRCLGEHLAMEIITAIFMELFGQESLKRASGRVGRMQRAGYFPRRMDVEYESTAGAQTMVVSCIPVTSPLGKSELEKSVEALGNPAGPELAQALDATEIVHFASASVVGTGKDGAAPFHLIVELNVDGGRDAAIATVVRHADNWLAPLLRLVRPGDERSSKELLRRYALDLRPRLWGATGLNFVGTGDFPVRSIEKQARLRERVETKLAAFLQDDKDPAKGLGNRASRVLNVVRRSIRGDPADAELDAFLVQPGRRSLPISTWRKPAHFWSPLGKVLKGGLARDLAFVGVPMWLAYTALFHAALTSGALTLQTESGIAWLGHLCLVSTLGLISTAVTLSALAASAYALLLWTERREAIDDLAPDLDRLKAIQERENSPTHRQNHIIAVSRLKPGLVRRVTLALSMWGIAQSLHWFRPGFVVTMGTIHYAKWFRLPDSDFLIFQSNYDGSWESYLEDFITRAHHGQTAAWSNGVGFPRSSGLIGGGARDGDRFKRWVRRQQIPTAFWYSRFPTLTTREIRTNALIHDGLVRANSESAARSWLDLLGSAQRQPWELESTEIQSLTFRGLKRALFTACMPLRLPEMPQNRGDWLRGVLPDISYGKFPEGERAMYLAFSAGGLGKFNQTPDDVDGKVDLPAAFPGAFATGMANRGAILGDLGPNAASSWRWTDSTAPGVDADRTADAVLFIYAPTRAALDERVRTQRDHLERFGGAVVHNVLRTVPLGPAGEIAEDENPRANYEHFGFRDGVSSPIIRGTEQFTPRGDPDDIVEPGEFILGYRNNQSYFAPSVMVPARSDAGENLPLAADSIAFGFADFRQGDEVFSARDFGRNGVYIAIRQLAQDVDQFDAFIADQAETLKRTYGAERLRDVVGSDVTADWVGAKLMGRWKNGLPLIGNPTAGRLDFVRDPDNGFSFGRDDPRGHACPLGAHIRRANPRDSLEPNDPLERLITKRHFMLRRGRTYFYDPATDEYLLQRPEGAAERGLLFVALCADLERQFELVQQTWLGFPSFHGLTNEPDPIAATQIPGGERRFTIPTSSGPLVMRGMSSFVEVRGGGYFFLPSRSALNYLSNFTKRADVKYMSADLGVEPAWGCERTGSIIATTPLWPEPRPGTCF